MGNLVSIIIPTFNASRTLKVCLTALKNQSHKATEIIIVDEQSSDDTLSIAESFGVTVLRKSKPKFYSPPSASRNLGASMSKGEYLLHLDADMELFPDCIEKCISSCLNFGYSAVTIHEIDRTQGFWSLCKALERSCYIGNSKIEAARFVHRELFTKVGGYDQTISAGEDWAINYSYKKYGKVGDSNSYLYHLQNSISLFKHLKKKFSYGRTSSAYLSQKARNTENLFLEMLICYLRSWKKLLKDPSHTLGFILLRALEIAALSLGIMYDKFSNSFRRLFKK